MTEATKSAPPRVSWRQNLAYGVGDVGGALPFTAANTWLFYFLVNIAGLVPLQAGIVVLVGRLLDAVTDPVMGLVSDRYRHRLGRLSWVRWGALPLGTAFALMWVLPLSSWGGFVLAILIFALVSLLFTVVVMPYMALLPEIAPNYDDRTRVNTVRASFSMVAVLIAVSAPPAIVLAVTGTEELAASPASGWIATGAVFGALTAASFLCTGFLVREPRRSVAPPPASSLLWEVRAAWHTHGFRQVFALFVVLTLAQTIVNSILPFYLESVLLFGADLQSVALGATLVIAMVAFFFWSAVSARSSKRTALAAGTVIYAAGLLLLVTVVPSGGLSGIMWVALVVQGVGLSAIVLLPWAMLPDVVEFDELESGRRREGIFYAGFTFGQKTAGSLAVFANAVVVGLFGYRQGVAEQSTETVFGLQLMMGPATVVVLAVAIFFVWRYPITRDSHEAARAALSEKRGL